ncbi:MAG: response regulator transcription factor [Cellvibrionaceae bacterium]
MATIFWVEDQTHWINKFSPILENSQFDDEPTTLTTYRFASAAKQEISLLKESDKPDIAILDAHMSGNSGAGFSVSRMLLNKWPELPIIFLSEHSGTEIEQTALEETGAQDFIAKHQHNIEEVLCWRIKAILRKTKPQHKNQNEIIHSGALTIDLSTWDVYWHKQKLMNPNNPRRALAPTPRKILYYLVQSSPRPLTTQQIADRLGSDPDRFSYANYRQHIKILRHSFDQAEGAKGSFIEQCKQGTGIVTFGDLGAYSWKN